VIESVDSALRLLRMFLDTERIRISEAAAGLGVAPSTAHRLMAMLQYHEFVVQDGRTHEYMPGPNLTRIGTAATEHLDLRHHARPLMERLSAATGETVGLGTLHGASVLYLEGVEGPQVLRVAPRLGVLIPAHCISMGKALLAALPVARLEALYPTEDLPGLTERSVSRKSALLAELKRIRRRGYAQSSGESESGVASIAMAVVDAAGSPRAAVSVAAPAGRLTSESVAAWLPGLRDCVTQLSGLIRIKELS
jgi:DNA-binding IclR family transcriptional regulator